MVTAVDSIDHLVEDLVRQVDEWLALTGERDLFSADDVQDRLLDLRLSAEAVKAASS